MSRTSVGLCVLLLIVCAAPLLAQQPAVTGSAGSAAIVPPLVSFNGVLTDLNGKPMSGSVGVTFALYKDEQGGAPLWLETQNVYLDKTGHYTVLLGSTTSTGLPADLFVAGEARWLGVQGQGQSEQSRILLASAPYALKAADAQTLGGLPPSAFVTTDSPLQSKASTADTARVPAAQSVTSLTTPSGSGTTHYIPIWTGTTTLGNSTIFESGGLVGINTTTPATALDVKGGATIRGQLNLPPTKTATASTGYNSEPLIAIASAFNSSTSAAVNQRFWWQAEPVGNDTASPSGTLNLLYATGTAAPAETGLNIANSGQITFAAGQTFPGAATLGANTFTGNQTVNGNLSATGVVTGSGFQIGSNLFDYGSYSSGNASLGFAGGGYGLNNTASGVQALYSLQAGNANTADGYQALYSNAGDPEGDGSANTASGAMALTFNNTGAANTASGYAALYSNTSGYYNTASGDEALYSNTSGSYNTALGISADVASGALNYATAIGAYAQVSQSNSLVLGSIVNVNYCSSDDGCASAKVGIGTTAPSSTLDVRGGLIHVGGVNPVPSSLVSAQGAYLGWNETNGGGETDFFNNEGTGGGGWYFINTNSSGVYSGYSAFINSSGVYNSSSRRWKTNIKTVPDALAKVEQLRGVTYDRKDSGKHEIGLIAEEVGAVVPEVVSYEKNGKDAAGVDYGRLTALLIEATKEQQKLIEKQQQQISLQQAQIARLGSQVRAIQTALKTNRRSDSEVRTVKAHLAHQ